MKRNQFLCGAGLLILAGLVFLIFQNSMSLLVAAIFSVVGLALIATCMRQTKS